LKFSNFYDVFEDPAEALAKHPAEFRWDGGYIFFKLHETFKFEKVKKFFKPVRVKFFATPHIFF
jgi:hypothetical protein